MYEIGRWVDEFTGIGAIYNLEKNCMNDDRIAAEFDVVNPHIREIWSQIVSNAISIYKIAVAYHERNDIDFLGTVQLTNVMKKLVSSIEDNEYKIIDTMKGNGLYKVCMKKWTFSFGGKSFTDNILVVNSEQKLLDDAKIRANRIICTFILILFWVKIQHKQFDIKLPLLVLLQEW